jgi:hypothetical protein
MGLSGVAMWTEIFGKALGLDPHNDGELHYDG